MTFIAVPITVDSPGDVATCLERAGRAARQGAALVEWRIDPLASEPEAPDVLVRLVKESPLPCIVTCRIASEGGAFTGADDHRRALLEHLARSGHLPRYVDIEHARFSREPAAWLAALMGGDHPQPGSVEMSIILSAHDTQGRPADLLRVVEALTHDRSANVIKVAWHARSLRDNLQCFDLLTERGKPMIALCMGPFGLMSRVLAPKFGGFITFAADAPGLETAPGQPTIEQLKALYRFDHVGAETKVYGVIGWPVDHSLGPVIHNAGFEAAGHDGVYLPLPIPGDSSEYEHFKATVGELVDHPRLHFRGASVTIPHKENLLRFVDERGGRVDAFARLAGAANTLLVGATGAIACRNTDAPAIVDCLCDALNVDPPRLAEHRFAVLGAGGVARAALAGLSKHGAGAVVFNRSRERAEQLIADLRERARTVNVQTRLSIGSPEGLRADEFDVFINCTPVGMAGGPSPDLSPLEVLRGGAVELDDSVTVFDTVYTPSRTPLIEEAESRGARVVLGVDLFVRQAALQFEGWTGEEAPIETWREVLRHREPSRAE
ncbi:MAG: type I 3-dehydroquinate dehydratase [Phycisphaeraceae bacterium]|nr:MAG: type I 3-dehydroquinate dehydratase [Phycisphaeraceae bacterium]